MGEIPLHDLFEDLEQQAAGLELTERDAELADRARSEYAAVTVSARVHASLGRRVRLMLTDGAALEGVLAQAGPDWCWLGQAGPPGVQAECLVRLAAVAVAEGLSPRAVAEAARPAVARLGFGSALHRCAGDDRRLRLRVAGAGDVEARVRRIGADFVEIQAVGAAGKEGHAGEKETLVVPFAAVNAAWARW